MIDIEEIMKDLAKHRPIFHSEADFQHAFAWEIHKRLPDSAIRLELPFEDQGRPLHLDVWVSDHDANLAIELKYKTRGVGTVVQGEHYALRDQSAQDLGRYDFIKDIVRLEKILIDHPGAVGYAILLTNDSAYWSSRIGPNTIYEAFRIEEGATLQGTLSWGKGASQGTMRDREAPLALKGKYKAHWQDYSQLTGKKYAKFRFVGIQVKSPPE
jgi:hypothetical protein